MTSSPRTRATGFTAAIAIVAALLSPLLAVSAANAAYPSPFVGVSANGQNWADEQLGAMTVGTAYSDSVARAPGAHSWEVVGTLPAGLSSALVGDDYVISGTPTTAGDRSFEIWSTLDGETDKLTFSVTVIGTPSTSLSLIVNGPTTTSPGQTQNWEIRIKNSTGAYALNPTIRFTPPPGFQVSQPFAYPNWNCSFSATIVCSNSNGLGFNADNYAFTFVTTAPSSFATSTVTSTAQVSGTNAPAVASSYTTAVNLPDPTIAQPVDSSYRSISLTGYAPNLATTGSMKFFTSAGLELGSANVQSNGSATFTGAIPASLSGTSVGIYAEYYNSGGTYVDTSATSAPVYIYQQLTVGGGFFLNGQAYTGDVSLHIYADGTYPGYFYQRDVSGGTYTANPSAGLPYEYYMFASIDEAGTTHYNDANVYLPGNIGHTTVGPQNFTDTMNFYWESAPVFTDSTIAAPRQNTAYTDEVVATSNVDVDYEITTGTLPTGLSLDEETGAITGTATVLGQPYELRITASNGYGTSSVDITGTVLEEHTAPTWTDQALGEFRFNQTVTDGVAASGDPTIVYEVSTGHLPTGVTLNETTGQLAGSPSVLGEQYEFQLHAYSDWGSVTADFDGEVLPVLAGPAWTDSTIGELRVGETLTDGISASGEPVPTYTSLNLPSWVTLNAATGAISATPTVAGPYDFTITAANSEGSVSQQFIGEVEAAWIAPTFTDETILPLQGGVYLDDQVLATGDGPITYSVPLGDLPSWLTLNAANGLISGTAPLSAVGDPYSFTVTASAHGFTDAVTISGVVAAAPEVILDPTFVVGDLAAGAEFDFTIAGAEGLTEYSVTVNSTPAIVASGFTSALGSASGVGAIPSSITPGAHSIVLLTSASDGTPRTTTVWFTVLANGRIGAISLTGPFSVTAAAALAATGVDIAPLGAGALLMLLAGFVVLRRQRRSQQA